MAVVISLLSIAALTAIDQIIKHFVETYLKFEGSITVITDALQWDYVQNTGAAFGILKNSTNLLSIITGVILVAGIIAIVFKKIKNKYLLCTAVIIISGGLGNLIDRMLRGYVVDFIRVLFIDFPVFNFADILVTCGAMMLLGYLAWDIYNDYKKKKSEGDKVE